MYIRAGTHRPSELYLDAQFLNSLRFGFRFDRDSLGKPAYHDKMMRSRGKYYCIGWEELLENLESGSEES